MNETDEALKFDGLPLPRPTEAAIEAGVFGYCADGTTTPNVEEIQSIVAVQVIELAELAIVMETSSQAEEEGRHPTSGKVARNETTREAYRRAAKSMGHDARLSFYGHLNAYERAFGHEAAQEIREHVFVLITDFLHSRDKPEQQLELF